MSAQTGGLAARLSDKITGPMYKAIIVLGVFAIVFLFMVVFLIVAAFKTESTVAKVAMSFAIVLFFVQFVLTTMLAVFVGGVAKKVDNTIMKWNRRAMVVMFGGKVLNSLLGRNAVDEKSGDLLPSTDAATSSTATGEATSAQGEKTEGDEEKKE